MICRINPIDTFYLKIGRASLVLIPMMVIKKLRKIVKISHQKHKATNWILLG